MRAAVIILAALCCGCLGRPPLNGEFTKLYRKRNIVNVYDCSNKAGDFARALRKAGHKADLAVVYKRRKKRGPMILHAIVTLDGKWYDPTWGIWGDPSPRFGILKERVPFENIYDKKWGKEFK